MKYMFLILPLILISCTSKDNDAEVRQLKSDLRETKYSLSSCENSLSVYRGSTTSTQQEETPEETSPPEPQYEEVNVFYVSSKDVNTSCKERNNSTDDDAPDLPCGMTFSECKDGYVYRCMLNVKYKVVKEKHLIEGK